MSRKVAEQFCAICEREKRPSVVPPETPLDLASLGASKENYIKRHKYGHLPAKKNDDFVQVTEPQWLRRGNLTESDYVCKRHLAILMRGVDRGCEGGCSSPLHRGARLCRPGNLKPIPPAWRKRFMQHPKIKDEDKEVMMFCWDCYKKHMNRMSKHGDPMGRPTGKEPSVQRSQSMADSDDSAASILEAMKKYKSMDKLDSEIDLHITKTNQRRAYSSSSSPRNNGDKMRSSKGIDLETRSIPSRRTNRGRRAHKGKRSPSPPDNISPVRTSVVHSKRKHSPHKYSKSPSAWRYETSSLESSPRNLGRLSVDEGALADTESPRAPPVPPPGLFSLKIDSNDEVFDVFASRSTAQLERQNPESASGQEDNPSDRECISQGNAESSPIDQIATNNTEPERITKENGILECGDQYQEIEKQDIEVVDGPIPVEECTTSADEMSAIFANGQMHDNERNDADSESILHLREAGLPDLSDDAVLANHEHESSSGSSSDKTGETQIERKIYATPDRAPVLGEDTSNFTAEKMVITQVEQSEKNEGILLSDNIKPADGSHDHLSDTPANIDKEKNAISAVDFSDSHFLSPVRKSKSDLSPIPPPSINYSLSPQSFRRLESLRLQFQEELTSTEGVERHKLNFDDGVREKSHPMRNHVVFKLPRVQNGMLPYSYIRLPAEDVEIFPDTLSFLEGITQTMGDEMAIYAQEGVRVVAADIKRAENRSAHRTSMYSDDFLIARRGQPIELVVQLSEKYDEDKHKILTELMIGDAPRVSNGTHQFIPIQPEGATSPTTYGSQHESQWSGRITSVQDCYLTMLLTPNSTCPIGSYKLYFQVEKDGKRSRWQAGSEYDRKIIVIFNPWNIEDAVFLSSQADRQEYVVCDAGCMYSGGKSNFLHIPWIYGQYEPGVLQACVDLVESTGLSVAARGDPVSLAKGISKRLTELSGVQSLTARSKPAQRSECSGAAILQRLFETGLLLAPYKNKSLAGLLVTVFRCIGLPARPVSCTNCALGTDLPMNVNFHYSQDGHSLDHMNSDKLWPTYTWAEVWMSRVDLPPGFGGWQVLLPPTNGVGYVGPIPGYGIKKGQTSCCDGTKEHFMALNAHKKYWVVSEDGNMRIVAVDHGSTGTFVITKSVGSLEHQDVTKLYKFNEGCEEQKMAMHTACMHCGGQNSYDDEFQPRSVVLTLTTNPTVISLGSDVEVVTKIKNNSDAARHLTITLDVAVLTEDGSPEMKVQRETILAEVLPRENVGIPVTLNLAPCLHKLSRYHHLSITAFGRIRETDNNVVASYLAPIKYPEIEMQLHGEFKVGGELTILSKLRNPIPYPLTNAKISLDASGLTPLEISTLNPGKSVGPWQVCKSERVFRCQRIGKHTIVATFTSDHLNGPVGVQEFEIT